MILASKKLQDSAQGFNPLSAKIASIGNVFFPWRCSMTEAGGFNPREGKAGRFALEIGHLGRILARSPRFLRSIYSINTGLPDMASGPFFAPKGYGLKGQESIAQAKAHARQLKRLNGSLKRRRRVGA